MNHLSQTGRSAVRRRAGAGAVLLVLLAGSASAATVLVARWAGMTAGHETLLDLVTGPRQLDEVLGELAAGAALLVLLATALSTASAVALAARARAQPGRRRLAVLETALAPVLLRRLAATALGVGVLAGAAATGASAAAPQAPAISAPLVPAWPAAGENAVPQVDEAPEDVDVVDAAPAVDDVVVVPGDTLWDIAAAHLPEGAAPGAVAERWPRWWSANRGVIGDDPDLILPGQQLTAPAGSTS